MNKEPQVNRHLDSTERQLSARKVYLQIAGSGLFYLLTGLLLAGAFNRSNSNVAMPLQIMVFHILTPMTLPFIGMVAGLRGVAIGSLLAGPVITLLLFFASEMSFLVILMGIPMSTPLIAFSLQLFAADGLRSMVGKFRALLLSGIMGSVAIGLGIFLGNLFNIKLFR